MEIYSVPGILLGTYTLPQYLMYFSQICNVSIIIRILQKKLILRGIKSFSKRSCSHSINFLVFSPNSHFWCSVLSLLWRSVGLTQFLAWCTLGCSFLACFLLQPTPIYFLTFRDFWKFLVCWWPSIDFSLLFWYFLFQWTLWRDRSQMLISSPPSWT